MRAWFAECAGAYPSRPVTSGGHSAWYRLVPRDDIIAALPVREAGPVFASVAAALGVAR
jgi:hypothetical protein